MAYICDGCGVEYQGFAPIRVDDLDANPDAVYEFHAHRCKFDWDARQAGEIRLFAENVELFANAKKLMIDGGLDWNSADPVVKVALIDGAEWEHDLATDDFLDDVTGNGIAFTASTLGTPTVVGGKADGADTTFTSVTDQKVITGVLFYVHNADAGSAPLIAIAEDGYGLPYTASGENIKVVYPTTGIFQVGNAY